MLGVGITWVFAGRPWNISTTIGAADSALLGPGFFTKEATEQGIPFRWTTSDAELRIPWLRSEYLLSLRADTGTGSPHWVVFNSGQQHVAAFPLTPGFRTYRLLWPAEPQKHWIDGLGEQKLHLLSWARAITPGDERLLGIAVSDISVRDLKHGNIPLIPMILVGGTIAALALVLLPLNTRRLLVLLCVALGLPLLYELFVWHPPVGTNHAWLPFSWLPWLVVMAVSGLALWRLSLYSPQGALVAAGLAGLLLICVLLELNGAWNVTGPDYTRHLNRSDSWERVLRGHGYYPFGYPLILWMGILSGGGALEYGRAAGLFATCVAGIATATLAWRLVGGIWSWLALALLLSSPVFLAYGVFASTDAPMYALTTLALVAFCWAPEITLRRAAVGGMLLGLAYLFRHQALALLVPALIWLSNKPQPIPEHARWYTLLKRFIPAGVALIAFVIGSAPQWILDSIDFGRPFYNRQYTNIWVFAFNQSGPIPGESATERIWFLLNYDPFGLWRHWTSNLQDAALVQIHALFRWPISMLALVGLAAALIIRRDRRYALLVLWTIGCTLVVALTETKDRFFLPIIPVLISLALAFIARIRGRLISGSRFTALLALAIPVALWYWGLSNLLEAERVLRVYGELRLP